VLLQAGFWYLSQNLTGRQHTGITRIALDFCIGVDGIKTKTKTPVFGQTISATRVQVDGFQVSLPPIVPAA
jgi:hypothetical protein